MSADYVDVLREARDRRPLLAPSRLEHFTLLENEIYLALTLPAAVFCAEQSLGFAAAHWRRFRRLPETPFPLMVLRVPEACQSGFLAELLPLLSDRGQLSARKRASSLAEDGLGIYVYFYRAIPMRAAHARGLFPGAGGVGLSDGQRSKLAYNVEAAIAGWISLFARMLVTGYMPTTKVHTGNCLQLQNLTVDGGFCDIDSIELLERIDGDRDFDSALLVSMTELVGSIAVFLGLDAGRCGPIWTFVWNTLRRQVIAEAKRRSCDPRLARLTIADDVRLLRWLVRLGPS